MWRTSRLFSVPSSYFRSRDQAASVQRRCSSPVLPTAQTNPAFVPLLSKSGIRITLALGLMQNKSRSIQVPCSLCLLRFSPTIGDSRRQRLPEIGLLIAKEATGMSQISVTFHEAVTVASSYQEQRLPPIPKLIRLYPQHGSSTDSSPQNSPLHPVPHTDKMALVTSL